MYILFILLFSGAHADYIAALKPTQISQSVDYAFKYSLLRTIDSSNYEEHKKKKCGAQISDISETGSYE